MERTTLGVVGGLGPAATAYFMELVTAMTDAKTDQEHLDMIVYSRPSIPDRTAYILDHTKESPLSAMAALCKKLTEQGARCIAIPCMTAHYFHDALSECSAPIIHGIRETVAHLKSKGITKAGILATDGTIRSGLFHDALAQQGLTPIAPSAQGQARVMQLIYRDIKAGKQPDMACFHAVRQELLDNGAQAIILGCTELSLIKRDYAIGAGFIDVLEVLAQQSVLRCGAQLKEEYQDLISK